MTDQIDQMARLRRPKLLIRAARFGQRDYDRNRDLRRLLATRELPGPEAALRLLMAEEDGLEAARQAGEAGYSFLRHIEVLIAMMAEARGLPQARQPAQIRVA
ncbi:DUF6477 family protein [Rhodobacter capsulatus]|jgi:hypothetical protein|uniref:Uncharacterized protein n=2 Tax=root TaxID=1 RepID=D5AUH2_RHOCB|nr:DUF6477 family protein [Rhodobacter capsulatus]DBA12218.1 TPA_asm: maturation/assembly protein-like protein [Rhodobactegtaviriform marrsi]ADE85611.1 conserved hypothetical protein [Rhodobacter capsulatus SB 1003]ETD01642.1 hypothetical protein U714_10640 [Rhodobacter capsulatus DE442]ETD76709.1 hypothetical protein U717_10795 [Rhodobacter capsulatus R121]ETD84435.1 hypothetical protein U703_04735 [Rhodobacter capsulatus YW1]